MRTSMFVFGARYEADCVLLYIQYMVVTYNDFSNCNTVTIYRTTNAEETGNKGWLAGT